MARVTPDLIGKRFNRLVVVERYGNFFNVTRGSAKGPARWRCVCDCGAERLLSTNHLTSGAVQSCGCLSRDRCTTHKMHKTRVYRIWHGMICRCRLPSTTGYKYYGGRGISFCSEWATFEGFYKDMGDPPTDLHTLDRINSDGNYEPSNCRWATRAAQQRNRRVYKNWNSILTADAVREIRKSEAPRVELAKRFGVSVRYITQVRTGRGWKHVV